MYKRQLKYHKCKLCEKSFSLAQTLKQHIDNRHNEAFENFLKTENVPKIDFTENLEDNKSVCEKEYHCNLCENLKAFTTSQDLIIHHYIVHEGQKCLTCGLVFATTKLLNDHNHELHGYVDNKCYFCDYEYSTEEILEKHR